MTPAGTRFFNMMIPGPSTYVVTINEASFHVNLYGTWHYFQSLWYVQILWCIMVQMPQSLVCTFPFVFLSLRRLVWTFRTCKLHLGIFYPACLRLSPFSQSSCMKYMVLCISPCPFLIGVLHLIFIKNRMITSHCLKFGQEIMVYDLSIAIFL